MTTRVVPLGRGRTRSAGEPTALVGILNVTPDSFSDGGRVVNVEDAVARARAMAEHGAIVIDVGGESTRPGAEAVSEAEELRRVTPVVRAIVDRVGIVVSVDTTKAAVFQAAWDAGASMLNDVSAMAADPSMASCVASTDAAVVLMHRRGTPSTMVAQANYTDVAAEVALELAAAVARASSAGIDAARVILDPGLGFAKRPSHNWDLIRSLETIRGQRFPLMVGPSRKSFLGSLTDRADPAERDVATAVVVAELARLGVELVRVHDVRAARDAVLVSAALHGEGAS